MNSLIGFFLFVFLFAIIIDPNEGVEEIFKKMTPAEMKAYKEDTLKFVTSLIAWGDMLKDIPAGDPRIKIIKDVVAFGKEKKARIEKLLKNPPEATKLQKELIDIHTKIEKKGKEVEAAIAKLPQ